VRSIYPVRLLRSVLLIAVLLYFAERVYTRFRLKQVVGTVTRINSRKMGRGTIHYYPTIRFNVGWDEFFYVKNNEYFVGYYSEGEDVSLLYNPSNPRESYLNSLTGFWIPLPRVLLFCVSMMGVFLAVVIRYAVFK
jgi:hypothetical protein